MSKYERQLKRDLESVRISASSSYNSNTVFAKKLTSMHPINAQRFGAFWYSHYWWINRFIFYIILILSIAGICLGIKLKNLSIIELGTTIFILSCLYVYFAYLIKRNWYNKLLFKLNGWDSLVNHNSFGGGSNRTRIWRHCKIKLIDFPGTIISTEELTLRENAFLYFIHDVHKSFYWKGGNSSDHRINWMFKNGVASGSVNTIIIKKIKDLIERDLIYIRKKFKTLSEVKITVDQNEFYVNEFRDFT